MPYVQKTRWPGRRRLMLSVLLALATPVAAQQTHPGTAPVDPAHQPGSGAEPSPGAAPASPAATSAASTAAAATGTATATTAGSAAADPFALDRLDVTGSRIPRAGFDTLEPLTLITRAYVDERGLTNIADALNEIPGFGAGITPEGGQSGFGVGVNFVNRFDLGSQRTLTLINGRRVATSNAPTIFGPAPPGSQVDLNAIPTAMIERVEVLGLGGAPTYGSDAIAGTVNVVLRKNYEGVQFGANFGLSDQGDNERQNVYALVGHNFGESDRGNFTLALTYDKVNGVLQKDRGFFSRANFSATDTLGNQMRNVFVDGPPGLRYLASDELSGQRRIWSTPFGGLLSPVTGAFREDGSPAGFGPNGNVMLGFDRAGQLVPYNPGIVLSASDADGGDGLNLAEAGQITSDITRMTVNGTARWALNDRVDLFYEGLFYSAESTELTDQWAINSPLFGGVNGAITFPSTYPLLSAQARDTLQRYGIDAFNLARASRDLVQNNASTTSELSRHVLGLQGEFDFADRTFRWEASANYGRSDARYHSSTLLMQNFVNALHVTRDAQGNAVCSPTPVDGVIVPGGLGPVFDPNCVPLDLFGEGRPSEAARNYVTARTRSRSLQEQQVYNVNLSSTLLDLWSGPLSYSIGFEHRRESGRFDPDVILERGLSGAVPISSTYGRYHTNEWFGEVLIPLVDPHRDLPLLKRLDVSAKYRHTDHNITGNFDAYTYGLQWRPLNDLELRGSFTRSFREPSITELFTPEVATLQYLAGDPCDPRYIDGGPNPGVRRRNCEAFFEYYGPRFGSEDESTLTGTASGNRSLKNEKADSYSYGFVWAPEFLDGLTVAGDYYRIKIRDVIGALTFNEAVNACFDNPVFDATKLPAANSYCALISRDGFGVPTSFKGGYANTGRLDFEGYTAEVRYRFDAGRLGLFAFGVAGYFPHRLTQSVNGGVVDELAGEIGNSKKQYQFSGNWQGRRLGLNLSANYVSSAAFNLDAGSNDLRRVDGYWLVHAGAEYQFNRNTAVRLAISNLFDAEPPSNALDASIGTYDLLGRRYNIAFEWKY